MGCKDALDDPGGVYRNSDGLLVRVEPRSLTWAELLGSTLTRRPSELLYYTTSKGELNVTPAPVWIDYPTC